MLMLIAASLWAASLAQEAQSAGRPVRPAGQSIRIPLSGTLPLRCNARVLRAEAASAIGQRMVLVISHGCNAEHIMQFSSPVLDEVLNGIGARITLDGADAYDRGSNSVSFLQSAAGVGERRLLISTPQPVDFSRLVVPGAVSITLTPR
ncbi:hypothetical protein GVO57_06255 [Sphingomonas changnyeongensis]|uniref:Uncharacterized protein n=1 Tax=Sphingomonas changnyeongensis TaxID=2698679 RepID=A0A7Z2NVG7_9SPHN|nr:hypothetical protein [Sphingomonas changnyeongensis]QHL90515.1 hypothetical protein GVO57_06255 [Sphingomonas changnyeongensis]